MPPSIVPPVGRVAEKWARRAASASGEYEQGVQQTPKSWAAAAGAAEKNYVAGVNAAAAAGRFGKGVAKAGDVKWKKNATEKGPMRYAQGVGVAQQDYAGQVGPYLEVIGRTDLPPRGPVGSEANYGRVAVLGKALRQAKTGR
jgi:hypothetical protein